MEEEKLNSSVVSQKVGQEQIHGLLFGDKLSWQSIIYDLINSEQLDPWDIDICLLSNKYLEKVRMLEEANFFVSSKVLLAASLLLRIKSEILLNQDLRDLDDILFGNQEEKKYVQERIELEEDLPELIPRTPLPRGKRVTLQELMAALGKAIKTENRRIKRVVVERQREMETAIVLPRRFVDIRKQITSLYNKLRDIFSQNGEDKIAFSDFSGEKLDEKINNFIPLLHLDYQHKILVEQEKNFEEIWIWLKEVHMKKNAVMLEKARKEVEEFLDKEAERLKKEDEEFEKLKKRKDKSIGKKEGEKINVSD